MRGLIDALSGCGAYRAVRLPAQHARRPEDLPWHAVDMARSRGQHAEAISRAHGLLAARVGAHEIRLLERTGKLMRPSRLWPGVEYLIGSDPHDMVQVIVKGIPQGRLCVVAAQGEPWPDRLLTILDLIESGQERRLWEMAILHPSSVVRPVVELTSAPPVSMPRWVVGAWVGGLIGVALLTLVALLSRG